MPEQIKRKTIPETTPGGPSGTYEAVATGGLAAVGGAGAAILSSVTPQSTTADLAGTVPKEGQTEARDATISGVAPESITADLAGAVPKEDQTEARDATISGVTLESTTADLVGAVPKEDQTKARDAVVSGVTPESTTADLAGAVPKEDQTEARDAMISGVTPESTTAGLAGAVPKEDQTEARDAMISGVTPESTTAGLADAAPIEGTENAEGDDDNPNTTLPDYSNPPPGAFPETPANESEDFGVKPIPASEGIGNPVSLAAGEKVPDPSEINSNTVDSTVTTSKEGYEQDASTAFPVAAAAAGVGIAGAAGVSTYAHEEKSEADSFGVNPIPASSGIGNPISVPAGEKIPEQSSFNPNTVESTATTSKEGYEKDASAALVAPAVVADATGVDAAADSALSVPETSKNMIPESSLPMNGEVKDTTDAGPFVSSAAPNSTSSHLASTVPLEPKREARVIDEEDEAPSATLTGPAPTIPEMVKESYSEAQQSPEAATSAEAVSEKALVENELLGKVKSTDAAGEPAPSLTAEGTSSAPVSSVASNVPAVVKDSISQAHQPAEAAAAQEVVNEKRDVESELLREVKPTDAAGEPAPTVAAATSETAPKATSEAAALGGATAAATTLVSPAKETTTEAPSTTAAAAETKDLSPASEDLKAPATPEKAIAAGNTPAKTTPGPAATGTAMTPSATSSPTSSATKEQKKKNRRSFFGRLKGLKDRFKDL
jgi:hypothetical protein